MYVCTYLLAFSAFLAVYFCILNPHNTYGGQNVSIGILIMGWFSLMIGLVTYHLGIQPHFVNLISHQTYITIRQVGNPIYFTKYKMAEPAISLLVSDRRPTISPASVDSLLLPATAQTRV